MGLPQNFAIDRKSQGFVVNYDTGERVLIPYNAVCLPSRGAKPDELDTYPEVEPKLEKWTWVIGTTAS